MPELAQRKAGGCLVGSRIPREKKSTHGNTFAIGAGSYTDAAKIEHKEHTSRESSRTFYDDKET